MFVLSDVDLKQILTNDEGIIILRRREKSITGAGYDLTIGFIRDSNTGKEPDTFTDEDNVIRYTLMPGCRYLVMSKEFLYLSSRYMATVHSRGSYALKGILVTSTTVDPNYAGCITGSLFNCSSEPVHIKKENQFATMVFHRLGTPTNSFLQINERGNPMDTQETFHGRYPNINSVACDAGDAYYGQIRKSVESEFLDALRRMHQKPESNIVTNEEISSIEILPKEDSEKSTYKNLETIKITFLIGNGFDLNLGLHTRYQDFYPYYIQKHPQDRLAKAISKDTDSWADLELELGQYTDEILPQEKEELWAEIDNLEQSLNEYLQMEMRRIHFEKDGVRHQTATEIFRSLMNFYQTPQGTAIESIQSLLNSCKNREHSFITFNYTDTLERCLNTLQRSTFYDSLHISSCQNQKALHIHGSINDNNIVLGVNDESQIANLLLRDHNSKDNLIKSNIIKSFKNIQKEEAGDTIQRSHIICIFGMSLGKTDQTWWYDIAIWLQGNPSRELIIFSHEAPGQQKRVLHQAQQIRNRFFNNGNIPTDMQKLIVKQIHVVINSNLFHFRPV